MPASSLLPWIVGAAVLVLIAVLVATLVLLHRLQRIDALRTDLVRIQGGVEAIATANERLERELRDELARGRVEAGAESRASRDEIGARVAQFAQGLQQQVASIATLQASQLEGFAQRIASLGDRNDEQLGKVRETVEQKLELLRNDSNSKLELMRTTVDEKLHATLEERLGQSFRLVSERLELVQRGLGEMQSLASGVGDLKRVLTNVRTRGLWGEVQLQALLEQVLVASQFEKNVATVPGSNERVEFAIRLPGHDDGVVWLPIDAKFPLEDFQRLQDAQDRADPLGAEAEAKLLGERIRIEAAKIRQKYVSPPFTTDFGILYLPVEALYAEALRRPGLAEQLQRDLHIVLAGPTTLAALLNSLQMGFRTLAIEKRSSEVWILLAAVKTEFGKFADVLAKTREKLSQASDQLGHAETRTRQIERKLRGVEALPEVAARDVLDAGSPATGPVVALPGPDPAPRDLPIP